MGKGVIEDSWWGEGVIGNSWWGERVIENLRRIVNFQKLSVKYQNGFIFISENQCSSRF